MTPAHKRRTGKGFRQAGALVAREIRNSGESRGFAISKVLTHWAEIVGPELAEHTQPVKIHHGRQGLGAALTVLTSGAQAPMVEMQKDRIRERTNAVYGYNAVTQINITQTAATGFAEGRASFEHAPAAAKPENLQKSVRTAEMLAEDVSDEGLRVALGQLGANVILKSNREGRS